AEPRSLKAGKPSGGSGSPLRSAFVLSCDLCRVGLVRRSVPVVQRHLHPALAARTLGGRPAGRRAHAQDRVLHDEAVGLRHDDLRAAGRTAPPLGTSERPHQVAVGHVPKLPILIGIVKIDSSATGRAYERSTQTLLTSV